MGRKKIERVVWFYNLSYNRITTRTDDTTTRKQVTTLFLFTVKELSIHIHVVRKISKT